MGQPHRNVSLGAGLHLVVSDERENTVGGRDYLPLELKLFLDRLESDIVVPVLWLKLFLNIFLFNLVFLDFFLNNNSLLFLLT